MRQVEQQIITAYHRRQVLIDLRHHLQKARQISERLSEAATKAITQHESFEPISSNMQEQFKADADLLARNLEPIKKQSWPPECSQDQIRALDSTTLANLDLANLHSASNAASYCTDLVIAILKLEQQIDDLLKDNRLLSAGVIQSPLLKEIGGIQEPCDQSKAGSYASHVAARIQLRPAAAMTLQKFNHPYQVLQMLG